MKTFTHIAAQGDLLLIRIDKLPPDLTQVMPEGGVIILGHSETGHHHVIDADAAEMYAPTTPLPDSILECFVTVGKDTALRHLRGFDTHEPIKLTPGVYRVRRQREYVPEGWRRAQD